MNLWRKIMSFFGIRAVQPVQHPVLGLTDRNDRLDDELKCALQKHKEASDWVISRSLDTIEKGEEARKALETVMHRLDIPDKDARGAFDLVSRGNHAHHPPV